MTNCYFVLTIVGSMPSQSSISFLFWSLMSCWSSWMELLFFKVGFEVGLSLNLREPRRCIEDILSHTWGLLWVLGNALRVDECIVYFSKPYEWSLFAFFLQVFILVFFDDILIYSQTWADHIHHYRLTLDLLRAYSLFVKMSKYYFGRKEVEYLAHILSGEGVANNSNKIQIMVDWSIPGTAKALRGFLCLTGNYRWFI